MVYRMRRNGPYAPLGARYYFDDRIGEAGEAAELLFIRGLAFCAASFTDGFMTTRQVMTVVGLGLTDIEERARRLVDVGLWTVDKGVDGYTVRQWTKWNRSHDEITQLQSRDAARKRRSGGIRTESERNPNGLRADSERDPIGIVAPRNVTLRKGSGPKGPDRSLGTPSPGTPPPPDALQAARASIADAARMHRNRRAAQNGRKT